MLHGLSFLENNCPTYKPKGEILDHGHLNLYHSPSILQNFTEDGLQVTATQMMSIHAQGDFFFSSWVSPHTPQGVTGGPGGENDVSYEISIICTMTPEQRTISPWLLGDTKSFGFPRPRPLSLIFLQNFLPEFDPRTSESYPLLGIMSIHSAESL